MTSCFSMPTVQASSQQLHIYTTVQTGATKTNSSLSVTSKLSERKLSVRFPEITQSLSIVPNCQHRDFPKIDCTPTEQTVGRSSH